MSAKTARKYLQSGVLPSQCQPLHDWATCPDAFAEDCSWVEGFLKTNSGLEAKYLFETLQRRHPGKYQDGQLRTFQRRVKVWKALYGPAQEVYFPQVYKHLGFGGFCLMLEAWFTAFWVEQLSC